MRSKRSSRGCTEGFTLIELLVALMVTGIIAAATLTIALNTRGMFETDQHRTTINQNLRAGIDLLGIDVRQAGERLPFDAPAVQITDGSGGAPDVLILSRNMLDYVLPVCKDISAGSSSDSIFVARINIPGSGKIPQGCKPVPDENGNGWPDNMDAAPGRHPPVHHQQRHLQRPQPGQPHAGLPGAGGLQGRDDPVHAGRQGLDRPRVARGHAGRGRVLSEAGLGPHGRDAVLSEEHPLALGI
jgi:prepilin-type N-terminal cleavage/methylation domain-containing protein